jgi:hypothetical protein
MKQLTRDEREALFRKRFYMIPMEVAYEAQKWAVSIDDTCIEALRRTIHEKKKPTSSNSINRHMIHHETQYPRDSTRLSTDATQLAW